MSSTLLVSAHNQETTQTYEGGNDLIDVSLLAVFGALHCFGGSSQLVSGS